MLSARILDPLRITEETRVYSRWLVLQKKAGYSGFSNSLEFEDKEKGRIFQRHV